MGLWTKGANGASGVSGALGATGHLQTTVHDHHVLSISSQADKHMVCRLVPPKGLAVSTISWKRNGGSEVVSASGEEVLLPPTFGRWFQISQDVFG